jgi:hypothetical protein
MLACTERAGGEGRTGAPGGADGTGSGSVTPTRLPSITIATSDRVIWVFGFASVGLVSLTRL